MKKLAVIFFLIPFVSLSQSSYVILQVNGQIITNGFANIYLKFNLDGIIEKVPVNYFPGDLSVPEKSWLIIRNYPDKNFILHVDYYTYSNGRQEIANFDIELSKNLIEQNYLIADIYDFRDKNYKRKYQYHTDKNYLIQFYYRPENGIHGIYIPRK